MSDERKPANLECFACQPTGNDFMEYASSATIDGRLEAIFVCRLCKRYRRVTIIRAADE